MNESDDYPYLDTMEEILWTVIEFTDAARYAKDDVTLGAYLKMASRAMRCALEIYGDHLSENKKEISGFSLASDQP